jgi:hypothetical protein
MVNSNLSTFFFDLNCVTLLKMHKLDQEDAYALYFVDECLNCPNLSNLKVKMMKLISPKQFQQKELLRHLWQNNIVLSGCSQLRKENVNIKNIFLAQDNSSLGKF